MKYCISGRQPKSVLKQADQIKMNYVDRDKLIDYIEELPDKEFILCVPKEVTELNWELIKAHAGKVRFTLRIDNLDLASVCRANGIEFEWAFPVFTWYELRSLIALRPCSITLGAPLFFELDKVKAAVGDISLRLCPNLAYDAYIPRKNGICGTWIRPEDIGVYEKYVDSFEFITGDLKRDATLLRIYKEDRNWPGNLNLLITNLGVNIDNRSIDEGLAEKRTKCGQKCMSGGSCHLCETCFAIGGQLRAKHYEDLKKKNK